jgi:hypothetical protein
VHDGFGSLFAHVPEAAMEKFIHRENLALFKKRLAESRDEAERAVITKLLGAEEAKGRAGSAEAMNRRGIEFTLVQVEPELWQWQFRIGESVKPRDLGQSPDAP